MSIFILSDSNERQEGALFTRVMDTFLCCSSILKSEGLGCYTHHTTKTRHARKARPLKSSSCG